MSLENKAPARPYFDIRIKLFSILKRLGLLFIILLGIKLFLFDSYTVKSDIISPKIMSGDRIIISRLIKGFFTKGIFKPKYGDLLLAFYPNTEKLGILRVAGKPGDTLSIKECAIENSNAPMDYKEIFTPIIKESPLAEEFSPRDNFGTYVIPQKGDTLVPPTMSIRDLIFTYSIILRENPQKNIKLIPSFYINDTLKNDFEIKDFFRYTGLFKNIPDSLYTDYLFWNQLISYLNKKIKDQHSILRLSIKDKNGETYTRYTVKKNYYFMLSDNWDGALDSRYFGPISIYEVKGKVKIVLWSISPEAGNIFKKIRKRRILKLIGRYDSK